MRQFCKKFKKEGADMKEIIFWMAVTVLLSVIEAVTANLVTVWFAVGAFGAVIAAAAGATASLQVAVFVILSAVSLALTRPIMKKVTKKTGEATNADKAIGEICIVTEDIDNDMSTGAVSCLGKIWTARTTDGTAVKKSEKVRVTKIDGVKLIVEPVSVNAE